MIWLSPMAGTAEGSIYFDIRDITVKRTGNGTVGTVCGLLGDGQRELWGEVSLGSSPQVHILPLWTDEGQIESFPASVDESLLKEQLLEVVRSLLPTEPAWVQQQRFPENDNNYLAA